ncbi:MAG: RNA polymerase sigma factor [Rubrivivax sp.]|jgi:RNA polymerase sigma-70 factor (ECF subfamily)
MSPPRASPTATADAQELQQLRRVAGQDRAALASLYRNYQPRLARFLARYTRQENLVEEVVNDTFWVVWRKAGEFRGEARVSTWIMGIAYRLALKAFRDGATPLATDSLDDDSLVQLSTDPSDARETRDWLDQGLRRLPDDLRTTVDLVYGQGYTLEETAAIMDCPLGTAKSRLFHARLRLRNLLPALAGWPATEGDRHV